MPGQRGAGSGGRLEGRPAGTPRQVVRKGNDPGLGLAAMEVWRRNTGIALTRTGWEPGRFFGLTNKREEL